MTEWIPPLDPDYESPPPKKTKLMRLNEIKSRKIGMEWMKLGEINPPPDMEILLWNKHNGAELGSVSYDASGNILCIEDTAHVPNFMQIEDYTHWCEIPKPTPEEI